MERFQVPLRQYFHDWLEQDGYPFYSLWDNVRSWWKIRHLPNVLLVHFAELKQDMPKQIQRIAEFLEIPIDETKWETILEHCSFYWEHLYAIEGEFTIWAGKNKIVLSTGENFLIPVGTPHVVGAIGDYPARGLIIAAPSAFARLIATVGTQQRADTLDLELFDRISAEIGDEILKPPETFPFTAPKT